VSKEKPILFNTEMVQAILAGNKTMTRRVIKKQPPENSIIHGRVMSSTEPKNEGCIGWGPNEECVNHYSKMPYEAGDILWVRETWTKYYYVDEDGYTHYDMPMTYYAADGTPDFSVVDGDGFQLEDQRIKWKPSIHMPRPAARLFLEITDIRVERLQDITDEDATAEGIQRLFDDMSDEDYERWSNNIRCKGFEVGKKEDQTWKNYLWHGRDALKQKQVDGWPYQYSSYKTAKESFSSLWHSIYAECGKGWDVNPWVWVVEFERMDGDSQ